MPGKQRARSISHIQTLAIVSVDKERHWVVYSSRERLVYDPLLDDPMDVDEYDKKIKMKPDYHLQVRYPRKRAAYRAPALKRWRR